MNIYRCTDKQGNVSYRASRKPNDILTQHYEGERLEFVEIEVYKEKVTRNYVFNHELPIYMCI